MRKQQDTVPARSMTAAAVTAQPKLECGLASGHRPTNASTRQDVVDVGPDDEAASRSDVVPSRTADGEFRTRNLLTAKAEDASPEIVADQHIAGILPETNGASLALCVLGTTDHGLQTTDRATLASPSKRKSGRAPSGAKLPSKRGPRGSNCLTWKQVKTVDDLWHRSRGQRMPLNIHVTIRAPRDLRDAEGKRFISRKVAHIGQMLKRRGYVFIGVTTYEKDPGGYLHGHLLMHVPKNCRELVQRRCCGVGGTILVTPADRLGPAYVTKQRQHLSPDFEALINRRWERGARIDGARMSLTKPAIRLLGTNSATQSHNFMQEGRSMTKHDARRSVSRCI